MSEELPSVDLSGLKRKLNYKVNPRVCTLQCILFLSGTEGDFQLFEDFLKTADHQDFEKIIINIIPDNLNYKDRSKYSRFTHITDFIFYRKKINKSMFFDRIFRMCCIREECFGKFKLTDIALKALASIKSEENLNECFKKY